MLVLKTKAPMRLFFSLALLFAITLNAFGQGIPQLPYNPDENGDGLIGVPDLQALLAQYGLEFNSAILSEDGENAVISLGDMSYPECASSCRNLPGFWSVAALEDLGIVWNTINSNTWLKREEASPSFLYNFPNPTILTQYYASAKCFCAAHELPKVEYSYCEGSDIQACAEDKVTNGWFPLNGVSSHHRLPAYSGGSAGDDENQLKVQAFWRWAE